MFAAEITWEEVKNCWIGSSICLPQSLCCCCSTQHPPNLYLFRTISLSLRFVMEIILITCTTADTHLLPWVIRLRTTRTQRGRERIEKWNWTWVDWLWSCSTLQFNDDDELISGNCWGSDWDNTFLSNVRGTTKVRMGCGCAVKER